MKVRTKFLMFAILISLFLGMFFHNESFAVPDYGEPGSYNTAFSIELVCESSENYEIELSGDYGYETRVYSEKILEENFYVKIASLVDIGKTIETSSFGILNYIGTEEIVGRHCYIYTADISDKTIFENKIIEDLRYSEYNFKFYYEIFLKDIKCINDLNINIDTEIYESGYYKYRLLNEKDVEIVAYTGNERDVNIPTKLDSFNVTSIGKNAFYRTWITTLVIPSTIKNIGEEAFSQCYYLSEICFFEGLENVGKYAFSGCKIRNINIPNSVKKIENGAFANCKRLEKVKLPSQLKEISAYTFSNCESLFFLEIPNELETIEEGAFKDCDKLEHIIIPSSVIAIKDSYIMDVFENITQQLTIYGIKGSYIHEYANINAIKFKDINEFNEIYTYKTYEIGKRREQYIVIETNTLSDIYCDAYWEVEDSSIARIKDVKNSTVERGTSYYVLIDGYIEGVSLGTTKLFLRDKEENIIETYTVDIKPVLTYLTDDFRVSGIYSKKYIGEEIQPNIEIKSTEGTKLIKDVDYTISYSNNINVGTATVTIKGIDTYAGEIIKTFNITPIDISNLEYSIGFNNLEYTGEELMANVSLKYNNYSLLEEKDYIVSYLNNIYPGTATLIIEGIGNYSGIITKDFQINLPFEDVSKNMWYYNAVKFTYVRGMIKGIKDTTFDPNGDLTRGMLVTILWRMEGSPNITTNQFTDVGQNMWYYNAVNWAANNKIVSGYGNEKFGPNDKITREQLAVMLRNYAIYKKKDVSARANLSRFVDKEDISGYATDAVSWAVANKVISGKAAETRVDPRGKATRAEVAAMLYNYCNNIK